LLQPQRKKLTAKNSKNAEKACFHSRFFAFSAFFAVIDLIAASAAPDSFVVEACCLK